MSTKHAGRGRRGHSVRTGLLTQPSANLKSPTIRVLRASIPLQVDVGFGDAITPAAEDREYPVLVGMAAPKLRMYPVETVIAEKLEAAVKLGIVNSRMQDFYDLLVIFRRFRDDDGTLARAIRDTFARRGTPLP